MFRRIVMLAATAIIGAGPVYSATNCDSDFLEQYRQCARIVDTLRPEKSGQARVFASDGSEFTAGQALWMQGQLRRIERLCLDGSPASRSAASAALAGVQDLLRSHQRATT